MPGVVCVWHFLYNLANRGTTSLEYLRDANHTVAYPTVIEMNPSILSGSSKLAIFRLGLSIGPTVLVSL